MFRGIETVRRLWRGEAVRFPGPDEKEVEVRTLPRPVQAELPVWVTAAGNPETFRRAGAGRRRRAHPPAGSKRGASSPRSSPSTAPRGERAGHPGDGHVTLMLHTFVGDDDDVVREVVREPMIDYLRQRAGPDREGRLVVPGVQGARRRDRARPSSQMFAAESLTPEEKSAHPEPRLRALLRDQRPVRDGRRRASRWSSD